MNIIADVIELLFDYYLQFLQITWYTIIIITLYRRRAPGGQDLARLMFAAAYCWSQI